MGETYSVMSGPFELNESASKESLGMGIYAITASEGESHPAG